MMYMNEARIAGSCNGHHVPPWLGWGQPHVHHRSAPTAHWSAQHTVTVSRIPAGQKPKLLDQVREAIRMRHYSLRTEEAYVSWIKRFILFHGKATRWTWVATRSLGFSRRWRFTSR
jgi:integrase-like protein